MRRPAARTAAVLLVAGLGAGCASPAAAGPRAPVARRAPEPATAGEREVAPAARGVVHVVRKGETAWRIARTYDLTAAELLEANGLDDPRELKIGAALLIPGAREPREVPKPGEPFPPRGAAAPAPAHAPAPGAAPVAASLSPAPRAGGLAWPVTGTLYSRFGPRNGHRHDGIDVSAPEGTPVRAAADGEVLFAGEQAGYGSIVILRHASGLVTVYAHASAVLVQEGASVRRGEPIARVGHTGRTTGPHLHFEVREGTRARDPLLFLP